MSIDVNPNTAFVTCPEAVAMSVGSAKNARYVSELPSMRRRGFATSATLATACDRRAIRATSTRYGVTSPARIASATSRMGVREPIAVVCTKRNASCSDSPCSSINRPLARSTSLRTSS